MTEEAAVSMPITRGTSRPEPAWLKEIVFILAAAVCLIPNLLPPYALAIGVVLALSVGNPYKKTGKYAKLLLQFCVVMLGFTMNLGTVLRAGADGALFAAATITTTLLLGWFVGKLLGTGRLTSLLISTGTAICGGSAIAAVGSVLSAPESEMTVAMGTVFTLNAVAIFLFPMIGHMLHMSQYQFGVWAGVAIHDVSSVVGAADSYDRSLPIKLAVAHGVTALQTATAVKLSRALWIVPLSLAVAAMEHRKHRVSENTSQKRPIQIPWFIGLFVLASVVTSSLPHTDAVAAFSNGISFISKEGLKLTLFLIGAGLSMKILRAVGWRALVQGIAVWAFISVASLLVIMQMN